jgi:ubiquinone/menaquinone biosynthesis C-methylase UbiE
MKVADFGAGAGFYTFSLARKVGKSGVVYAIVSRSSMLEKISKEAKEQKLDNIEIIWADIESKNGTSLQSHILNFVVIANTFFMIKDKFKVIEEIKRLLRPKGKVLVVEWSDNQAGFGPHKDHLVKEEVIEKLFLDAGFTKKNNIDAGDHHYGIIFTL